MASVFASRAPRAAAPSLPSTSFPAGALVAMLLLAGSWSWWGVKQGAYFSSVFNPGIVLLCAGFALLLFSAPFSARLSLSRPARFAVLGLVGLALWTLASVLWSPSPDISISDSQRVFAYLLSFALGAWLCNMLGRRMELALAPVVIAAGIVGAVTVFELVRSSDLTRMLDVDGTLQYPLGYRNATAAFFLIAVWPAVLLAAHESLDRRLRLVSALIATLSLSIGAICQSRGSFIGVALALVVLMFASPRRLDMLRWLIVCALPLAIMIPLASDLFQAVEGTDLGPGLQPMHDAGRGALAGLALTLVLGSLMIAIEPRLHRIPRPGWATGRNAFAAAVIAVLAGLIVFTVAVASPIDWAGDRFDEFEGGEPDLSQSSSRFTLNAGSNRSDVWRVAIDAAENDPLFGDGSGGFQYRYLRDREAVDQVARDSHSVELEMLSELGVPGLALLLLALGGSTAGIIRARRLGPNAAVLSAGALTAGAYWLGHSSFDWFWSYPAVTAPVFGLLGAACAPAMLSLGGETEPRRLRAGLGAAAVILALTVLPALFASRFIDNAYASFRNDLPAAYNDVDRAKALEPFSDEPLLAEGAIAQASGERERAISAFDEAIRKRPEEWAGHYFLAQIYAKSDPQRALSELSIASELNPLSELIGPLRKKINKSD